MRTADLIRAVEDRLARTVLRYLAAHGYRTAADYGASVGVRDGGELPDVDAVPKVHGLPGVTSKIPRGQPVLVIFQGGNGGAPVVALYPEGCVAKELGIDAENLIRFVGASAGVVKVGPGATVPVACAPAVRNVFNAIFGFATSVASATTVPQIAAAASAPVGATSSIPGVEAQRLEATPSV